MAKNKLMVGVLIGAAAGAAIGYLLTTKRGKEILSDIQDAASNASDKAMDIFDNAKTKVTENFKKSKQYADDVQNNL
jgi:gas vesicle protein